ncbi:MAG: LysE family translocator [Alphaproteobacteria bacterium]|nr:LysE family translocator [Alphaproteobacteria bacterium]
MTPDLYLGLVLFAVIMAFTPGPNNTILMASGLAHGFRRTLPAVAGVALGFPFLALCIGLGLGQLLEAVPGFHAALKYGGAAYLVWLAWKIASDKPSESESADAGKPLNFLAAVGFQWVNPKAWIMAITALSDYTLPGQYWLGLGSVVGTFVLTGISSASTWAGFGAVIKALLNDPRWFRPINIGLAVMLLLSLLPMLRH